MQLAAWMITWMLVGSSLLACPCHASVGDQDLVFRSCVEQCIKGGCINSSCFSACDISNSAAGYSWRVWDCQGECSYQCMIHWEADRLQKGDLPVQYYGKWPFKRLFGLQEPASVAFSLGNLVMHFRGWLSFLSLVYTEPPQKSERIGVNYDYSNLWIIYGLLSINAWIWSSIFHSRDVKFTERMDYLSAVAVVGYTLILAIIRTFNVKAEGARVIVASPIIAFMCTHILYLNLYNFDYGLNMKICVVMVIVQLLLWTIWGARIQHPARYKIWFVVLAGASAMLLELFDFPPVWGVFDAHSVWHAVTVPLTHYWWSFIKDDAIFIRNGRNVSEELGGLKKAR